MVTTNPDDYLPAPETIEEAELLAALVEGELEFRAVSYPLPVSGFAQYTARK